MKTLRLYAAVSAALALSSAAACAQVRPYLFTISFRGSTYETNNAGDVLVKPATEVTIMQDLGALVGITDVSNWALVYHINGSVFGDTIDVVDARSGAKLDDLLGFYFGSDLSLGRMALTNAFNTQERRVDQLYTKQSQFALGSAFVTKRFLTDQAGNTHLVVDADLHYLIRPQKEAGPRFVVGSFTSNRPFKPRN